MHLSLLCNVVQSQEGQRYCTSSLQHSECLKSMASVTKQTRSVRALKWLAHQGSALPRTAWSCWVLARTLQLVGECTSSPVACLSARPGCEQTARTVHLRSRQASRSVRSAAPAGEVGRGLDPDATDCNEAWKAPEGSCLCSRVSPVLELFDPKNVSYLPIE